MKAVRGLRWLLSAVVLSALCVLMAESVVFISSSMVRSPMDGWRNQIVDLSFQIRDTNQFHQRVTPDQIVIVDIDDASIEKLGRPQMWPRSYDARAIAHVASGHPKTIGIDFLYTEPDSFPDAYNDLLSEKGFADATQIIDALSTDEQLTKSIREASNVYLSFFDDEKKVDSLLDPNILEHLRTIEGKKDGRIWFPTLSYPVLPIDSFAQNALAVGSIAMPSMLDGTVRNYRLLQRLPLNTDKPLYTANFPFYMMLDQLGIAESEVEVQDNGLQLGDSTFIPLNEDGTFLLNWMGNAEEPLRYIPYHKVVSGRAPAEFFENKYVFFGTSASGMGDIKTVPTMAEKIPGVEVHAIAFLNMMNGAFIREVTEREALPWFFLIGLLQITLFLLIRPFLGFVVSLGLVFGEMMLFLTWIMPTYGIVFPIATLMLITIFAFIVSSLYIFFTREKKNRKLKNAFGSYVSPDVVAQIIKDSSRLQLGGEKKELTVLFSDIRGFTSYSERLDPQQIVAVLNDYLSRMSECIFRQKGTIDKFIGDAIMAIFGAPVPQSDHAERACLVALDMVNNLKQFNQQQEEKGQPPLRIGIGIHTGEMTVGNIGSARRFDYTVIGDGVNLGSRLEGLTKFFGTGILVSGQTRAACTSKDLLFREMASVLVKGKEQPVVVYELVNPDAEFVNQKEWLATWHLAIEHYKKQELGEAQSYFLKCDEVKPKDLTTLGYIKECTKCIMQPELFSLVVKVETK